MRCADRDNPDKDYWFACYYDPDNKRKIWGINSRYLDNYNPYRMSWNPITTDSYEEIFYEDPELEDSDTSNSSDSSSNNDIDKKKRLFSIHIEQINSKRWAADELFSSAIKNALEAAYDEGKRSKE